LIDHNHSLSDQKKVRDYQINGFKEVTVQKVNRNSRVVCTSGHIVLQTEAIQLRTHPPKGVIAFNDT
jgi:hypothetical protein